MTSIENQPTHPVEIGKTETIVTVAYHDLEELVKRVYEIRQYSFTAVEECGNDSSHRFDVRTKTLYDPASPIDAHALAQLEQVKAGAVPNGCNDVILQDLVNRGILRPAIYLIEVFW